MDARSLAGRRVLVMGLGRFGGGVGVARFLAGQGARVTVTDTAPESELQGSLAQLADLPITFKLGGHDTDDFTTTELVVTNPAVDKAKSPYVQAAVAAGVPLTSEMNLFVERCPAFTIGITGSVGKSTTTMLIYLALQAALGLPGGGAAADGPRVFLGGNIGKSLLADLPAMRPEDVVVLELSSFMLEDTPAVGWSPNVAVVTNLVPNHLDRHGTLAEYAAAKQNILRFQRPTDAAILNQDHDLVRRWASLARGRVLKFTTTGPEGPLPLSIPGAHNQSNARAALAVLEALPADRFPTLDRAAARQALAGFEGLSHRLQLVHTSRPERGGGGGGGGGGGVRWFNDSKATTPESSLTALEAFEPGGAIFIIGGYDKHADMTAFEAALARRAAGVLGIGQTGRAMVEGVARGGPQGPAEYVETLERAVEQAWHWVQQSAAAGRTPPAIVLSPACASWGQFKNYEERGELFAQMARRH